MNLTDASEYLFERAKQRNITEFDILGGASESVGVEVFEGKVSNTEISHGTGIGIRLFLEGRQGISFTEKFSKEALDQTLEDAISNSELTDVSEIDLPEKSVLRDIDLKTFKPELEKVGFDELVRLSLELEKLGFSKSDKIENIPYLGAGKSSSELILKNSKGVHYDRKFNSMSAGLGVTAILDDQKKMGYYSNSYPSLAEFDPDKMSELAVERAVEMLGAKPVLSRKYPAILSHRVSSSIIGMFLSPYFGETVQKGQSRLKGKLGDKIASEIFTMYCDPHIPGMPGSRLLDGEGVPTSHQTIVERGNLKTFLYHLESAKKDKVAPTGNGSRSYSGKAGTSVSNLFVEKGQNTLEELLNQYPECILVTKLEGASGCSAISGDISIGIQGFYCKDGIKVHPVDRITLSTNYFDMLGQIVALSNEYSDSYSSIKVPDILIESVSIAG
ncbi:MAG: metallopeptidase TldD-related protein [Leptospiraceae bacterium]|nr:metallopeptidase TldD-related protein [Leptospiraceae bacterium]